MCLVRIWRVLFWRAFADRHADRGVSRTLLFCPAIFLALLLSIATREAGRVLPAEVYNGSFISFSVSRVMQKQGPSRSRRDPMKTTTATLCVLLVLIAPSIVQSPTLNPVPNTIFAGADGKFETAPATMLTHFTITTPTGLHKH